MSESPNSSAAPDTKATPPRSSARLLRRVAAVYRAVRLTVYLLVLALVALVSGVLGTSAGSWLGLRIGLDVYNGMIAGDIQVERIEGSVLGGLTLVGAVAKDGQGRTIAAFSRLELDYTPGMFWELTADMERLRLDDPQVWLLQREDGKSAFLDLAPLSGSEDSPRPPDMPVESTEEFVLPLAIRLKRLEINRATVGDAERIFTQDASLLLSGHAGGPRADVWVHALSGPIPVADLHVENGRFHAAWDRSEALLSDLLLEGSFGSLDIESARFDPYRLWGEIHFAAHSPKEQVARWTGWEPPGDVALDVSARGDGQGLALRLEAKSAAVGARADAEVAVTPGLLAAVAFSLDRAELLIPGHPLDGVLNLDGRGRVAGDSLENIKASVDIHSRQSRIKPLGVVDLALSAIWAERDLNAQARVRAANTNLSVQGRLEKLERFAFRVTASSGDLSVPSSIALNPPLAGRFRLDSECEGTFSASQCDVAFEADSLSWQQLSVAHTTLGGKVLLEGRVPGFDVTLSARGLVAGEEEIEKLTLHAHGRPERINLVANVQRRPGERLHLDAFLSPGPPLGLRLAAFSLVMREHEISLSRPASLTYHDGALDIEGVFLRADQSTIGLDGRLAPHGISNLSLSLENFPLAMLRHIAPQLDFQGTLSLSLGLKGDGHDPDMRLELDAEGLHVDGMRIGDVDASLTMGQGNTRLRLHLDDAEVALLRLNLDVPVDVNLVHKKLDWEQGRPLSLSWRLEGISHSRLAEFTPIPQDLTFALKMDGRVSGTPEDFSLENLVKGTATWQGLPPQPLELSLGASAQSLRVLLEMGAEGPLPVHLEGRIGLHLLRLLAGEELDLGAVPLVAELALAPLPLHRFEPYLPRGLHGLAGNLSASMTLGGTLAAPELGGWLEIAEGRVELLALAAPLNDISLRLEAEGRRLRLQHLALKGGSGGSLRADGVFELGDDNTLTGDAAFTLSRFGLDMPGLPRMILNSRADMRLSHLGDMTQLDLRMGDSTVDVSTRVTKAPRDIPANANVRFETEVVPAGAVAEKDTHKEASPRVLSVTIELARPLLLRGDLLDMEWDGGLNIRMAGGTTKVAGLLEMERGRFDFLGNEFLVDSASLNFPPGTGNIPFLDLSAQASLPDATVNLAMKGRVTSPELSLQANPPMPEYQVFTLLVSGSVETTDESQEAVQGKAANLGTGLIAYKYPQLQQQLRQRTGIDRVGVSFGETAEQPIVTVGKRVNRRVYLETRYHHNAPRRVNRVEGRFELQLVPRWTLETYYGDSNIGGVDIFWHMRFAPLPPPGPPEEDRDGKPGGEKSL